MCPPTGALVWRKDREGEPTQGPNSVQRLPVTPHPGTRVAGARVEGTGKPNYVPAGALFAWTVPRVSGASRDVGLFIRLLIS